MPVETREAVFRRDGFRCRVCADTGDHVHHLRMRSQGGGHELDNLVLTCAPCHRRIHANPAWAHANGWLRRSGGQ
jgi:5-methylcytosine-specific restriction endonuclease McrA